MLQLLRIYSATYNYYIIKHYINSSISKYCVVLYIHIYIYI